MAKRSRTSTRARLLDAAYEVFCQRGFQATTVESICTRAGFTRGAFYSNFSTTEELFLALWDQQADRIIEGARALIELIAEVPDPREVAQAALVDLERVQPGWFVLNTEFFLHSLRHPEIAKDLSRHRTRLRRELGAVLTVLLRAEHRELPPDIDLDLFTRMAIAAHEGSQHQSLVQGHELEPGRLQNTMLTVFLSACPLAADRPDDGGKPMTSVHDIHVAHTPPGGYGTEMPPPVLAGCTDLPVAHAPDLRGTWKTVDATSDGQPLPRDHPIWSHVERIEQAGDRVVVTSSGIIHDMVADGTYENGVNDVMALDFMTPIAVAASFEHGVLVLRPRDVPDVEVSRWREGEQLVWSYHTLFTVRMERAS